MSTGSELMRGRHAYKRRAWADAYQLLAAAAASGPLGPEDCEHLAIAAYLSGHDDESAAAWANAHEAHIEAGRLDRAVHCAFWLGLGLIQRGEMAQGGGWMARARRLVEETRLDCVEAGYLLVPNGLVTLEGGDHGSAYDLFEQAGRIGRRFGDADLVALSVLGQGQSLLRMGRFDEGLSRFDEAMVAVVAGELSPVVAGIVYCAVIDECHQAYDMRRAAEWTAALNRWCDAQPGLVPYRGQCMVHRSQVLQLRGAWQEAVDEARRAQERLTAPPHPAVGMAHYQLGELHRLRGELDESEAAYRRAHESGLMPQPGLALLRLSQGRTDAAVAAIGRAVDEVSDHVTRARMLPACVEIMLAAGRVSDARAAADDLVSLAAEVDAVYLQATAAYSSAAVLLAEGRAKDALGALRRAWRAWQELEAPYEVARTRILIALACRALDDSDGVELECGAARRVFEELQAVPALARIDQLFGDPADDTQADQESGSDLGVTPREVEVLRLVATGLTNREIAGELVISEKTVERHLSNIFNKLGMSNRAAATAFAYDNHLL